MKIGIDAKRFFHNHSGLGNYSRDLIRILANQSKENQFILFSTNKSDKGNDLLALPNVEFKQLPKSIASRQLQMGKEAQLFGCDIFHGLSGELPLIWNNNLIKKVVTIHDLIFMRFPQFYSFFDRKIHYLKFKNAAHQADVVIAISEQTKKDIQHYLHIPENKIRVVYQGCHPSFKLEITNLFLNEVKIKFNLPDKFILNVGTIESRKNLFSIVKAIHKTDIPLVVVGKKTSYFNKIQAFIVENNMQNQVLFLDKVSMHQLAAIYRLASIFVYPSLFEGFGIPIIEALYSKTPVITSNLGCFPEAGGPFSLYVDPMDKQDILQKIKFLWENESQRNSIAEKSFDFVQKFNDSVIAKEMLAIYKNKSL